MLSMSKTIVGSSLATSSDVRSRFRPAAYTHTLDSVQSAYFHLFLQLLRSSRTHNCMRMAQGLPEQSTPGILLTFDTVEPVNSTPSSGSSYLKTQSGLLKVLQMGFSLLGFTYLAVSGFDFPAFDIPFSIITIDGFFLTGCLLISHLNGIDKNYPIFPWLKTEFIFCWILVVCNILALVTVTYFSFGDRAFAMVAFSILGAAVVYGMDGWLKYREFRSLSSLSARYQPLIAERY